MTAALRQTLLVDVTKAAQTLGKCGGRPKGSFSSPLSRWLRAEVKQRQAEGYRCREAFEILRDSEEPTGKDVFKVKDWTADDHDLDIGTSVTWDNYRKKWDLMRQKPVCVSSVRILG